MYARSYWTEKNKRFVDCSAAPQKKKREPVRRLKRYYNDE
jgi:hypothetical protein